MYRELEQPFVFILSEKWIYDADTECLRRYLSDRLSGEWYQCISCANTPHLLENEINDLKHAVLLWKSSLRWACFLFWCVCVCVQVFWWSCGGVEAVSLWHERSLTVAEWHWAGPGWRRTGPGPRSCTATGQTQGQRSQIHSVMTCYDLLTQRLRG